MSQLEDALSRRSERINIRVEPKVDQLLRRAASVQHKSLTAFMIDAAWERAEMVLVDQRRLEVRAEEFDRVLDELDRPAEVVAPLLRMAERVARQSASELVDH